MTTHAKSLEELISELPPHRQDEVRDFAEYLVARQRAERAPAAGDGVAARERFRRCFGSWDSGDEHSADNDKIDRDLAREYGKGLGDVP